VKINTKENFKDFSPDFMRDLAKVTQFSSGNNFQKAVNPFCRCLYQFREEENFEISITSGKATIISRGHPFNRRNKTSQSDCKSSR